MINKIKSSFHEFWLNKKNSEPKMRSYVKYKTTFCLEDYLTDIKDYNQRSAPTKLRISAHKMAVEKG